MSSWIRFALACLATSLVCACGAPLPDPRTYMAACDKFEAPLPTAPVQGIFFTTSRMPDCRSDRLRLATFRYPEQHFGISEFSMQDKDGYKRHASRLLIEDEWHRALKNEIDRAPGRRVLVYVHGYFNNFEDALSRAAILHGLYYEGIPTVTVSWPSRDRIQSYAYDEASIEWAQDYLDDLVAWLAAQDADVVLISHSMGGRALVSAVEHLDLAVPAKAANVRRIVLASPDIDRDQMLRQGGAVQRMLKVAGRRVLIYTSARDAPNRISRAVHGFARLGSSDCRYDVTYARRSGNGGCHRVRPQDGLAVVETSNTLGGFHLLRHSDFVDSCAVRADLAGFLRELDQPWRILETSADQALVGYRIDAHDPLIQRCELPLPPSS